MSTASDEICIFCVQQEAARLLSLCLDLNLDLKTREDVKSLVTLSGYSSYYKDAAFVEQVIDELLGQM